MAYMLKHTYVVAEHTHLFICQAALIDLWILPEGFPNHKSFVNLVSQVVGPGPFFQSNRGDETQTRIGQPDDVTRCQCPTRVRPLVPPIVLPLKEFIVEYYKALSCNKCTHHPLPLM